MAEDDGADDSERSAHARAAQVASPVAQLLDQIIEHMPAMVFMKDARERMLGKGDHDFFPKEQADFFVQKDREVLRGKRLVEIPEEPIETPRGTRWLHTRKIPLLDDHGEPAHLLGISLDITERRRAEQVLRDALERTVAERTEELQREASERARAQQRLAEAEEQLRHAQKMEALGRLAGGIAHDFNNLLSVVISYCDLLLHRLRSDERSQRELEEIRSAGKRAAELTSQLLAFSRQQVLQPRTLDLNAVVDGMQSMLGRLLGEDIALEIRTEHSLPAVQADPSQLQQVIMNLVLNARDAMPRGGRLSIATDQAAGTVRLIVSDTGVGMSPETQRRAFDPFFTTKEQGKGTGLGLATVFGIVTQSGGSVRVQSELGAGATFYVSLPACDARIASEPPGDDDACGSLRGQETILLVEDEPHVRALVAEILRVYGYRVLDAGQPSTALALAAGHEGTIHLVLTDVVMPEMGGGALAEQLLAARPDLRVLFMSGYADDSRVRHGVAEGMPFLPKPFTPEQLAQTVRATLDSPGPLPRARASDF